MEYITRITGHLRWKEALTENRQRILAEIAPESTFLTTNWADLTRTNPAEKNTVFDLLRALTEMVGELDGSIEFLYSGLTFEFFTVKDQTIYRQDAAIRWEAKQLIHQQPKHHENANIYEYAGMLKLPLLSDEQTAKLREIIRRYGTPYYEVETNRLLFHHTTDDFNRWYTVMMTEIAAAVVEAQGEVTCRVHPPKDAEGDEGEKYERFQMLEGRLLVQKGELIREAPVAIPT